MPINHKTQRQRTRLHQFARRLGITLLTLYGILLLGCAGVQRKLIYFPRYESPAALDQLAKSEGLERWKNSAGQSIGWRKIVRQQPAKGQLLVTHGNGGCAIDRFGFANPLSESGALDVYILEYPGFGDRAGSPSEAELCKAAEEAFQAMPHSVPTYLLGESLGTGVAAHLAGIHPHEIAGLLLVAPYNCLADVAQYHLKIFPARWILCDQYPSEEDLKHYQGPVAILVGGADTVVPAKFGRRLFDGYTGPKRLWEIPTGDHQSIHEEPEEFWNAVIAFWHADQQSDPALRR